MIYNEQVAPTLSSSNAPSNVQENQASKSLSEKENGYSKIASNTASFGTLNTDSVIDFLYDRNCTYDLGEAINIKDPRVTIQNKVLKIEKDTSELLSQDFEVHLVTSAEELRFALNIETKFAAKLLAGFETEAKLGVNYLLDSRNLTFVITGYTFKKREEANITNFEELKAKYELDPYAFHGMYGTHYVEHVQYGHYIYLIMTFTNVNGKFKAEITAKAQGGGPLKSVLGGVEASIHSYIKKNKVNSSVHLDCQAIGYENFQYGTFIKEVASENLNTDKLMTRVKQKIGEYLERIKTDTPQKLRYSLRSFNSALLNNNNFTGWSNQHDFRLMRLKEQFKKCMLYKTELMNIRSDIRHPYRVELTEGELQSLDVSLKEIVMTLDALEDHHRQLLENRNLDLHSDVPSYKSSITEKIDRIKEPPTLSLSALIDSLRIDEEDTNSLLSKSAPGISVMEAAKRIYGSKVKSVKVMLGVDGYKLSNFSFDNHFNMTPPARSNFSIDKLPFEVEYKCRKSDYYFHYEKLEGKNCIIINKFGDKFIIPLTSVFVQY